MRSNPHRIVLALSYLTFLLFGAFTASIGPTLGELSQRAGSSIAAIGGILTFLFMGSVIAQLAGGPLTDRLGTKPVLVTSMAVLALGILAFTNARSLPLMFGLALLAGLGQGGVDMGANLVVADEATGNTSSALNLLHFFFGLGAFIGPALVGLTIRLAGEGILVQWLIGALFGLLALAMGVLLRGGTRAAPAASGVDAGHLESNIYRSPVLWLMGALMLVYVGVEIGLGSWISTYMGITTGMLPHDGAWVTATYWAALALGRLAGSAASRRMGPFLLLGLALAGSLLAGVGLLLSHGLVLPTVICLASIAFSYATVYPTAVALATAEFPRNTGKAVGILVALGSIGAALLPFLAGALLENSAQQYLWFVLVSLALLPLLLIGIGRLSARASGPAS